MSKKSAEAAAAEVFKIPTHYVFYAYVLTTLALAFGVGLSVHFSDWMWLARFGALLVCLALMFEVTGLPEQFVNKTMDLTEGITAQTVFNQIMNRRYLYGVTDDTTDEQLSLIFDREHRRRLIVAKEIMIETIRKKIQRHEFFVASIGTLLWAFADLLNKL
ncbi:MULTISPECIES: hypothetical protein [unclassified Pseudomonas]|uniref:hypothetical protein n=1 Tax=unclassified Pseudomonas TaxID=196821 RepID=UPI0018883659|nr:MULTISPECIES: hypothetical protein [unclassified Pseudomonas]MDT3230937.1 hypothetical protein [Pseudomonas sp. rhizo25]QOY68972.1 hypothetical protein IH404_14195 [Pseudomonas sp. OST1909]